MPHLGRPGPRRCTFLLGFTPAKGAGWPRPNWTMDRNSQGEDSMDQTESDLNPLAEYLTTGALCRKLRITRSRIRRWVERGYIVPTYEWHRYQEWMHFPPEQVERARRLKWLVDEHGMIPSRAVQRLEDVAKMEERQGRSAHEDPPGGSIEKGSDQTDQAPGPFEPQVPLS